MAGLPEGQEAGQELTDICCLTPLLCWPPHRMFSITPDPVGPPPLSAKFWNGLVNFWGHIGILILSNPIPATRNEVRGQAGWDLEHQTFAERGILIPGLAVTEPDNLLIIQPSYDNST